MKILKAERNHRVPEEKFDEMCRIIMKRGRFKNDNRADDTLVLQHMIAEAERNIEGMIGRKVKLVAYDVEESDS